ncbi:hypothetical protein GCM10009837_15900 [Streptomyces durmitorensis]|uniref:Trypsin-like peptidase domain-containing protein n=1 Tax=Streptomyces durmitorensis TaxID=319947 RepID=A0ABY4PPH8_9ACTN|nr:trypsin-like peptidase domain-containing protein [Streptomyces durmitorensis]UQT55697.1 trypsin-like peptidase domain-containing protein [Streptomyces durmitorensis]
MRTRGLDIGRAAEIIVTPGRGEKRRGSGYLVRDGLVLTAEHVVHDAARVEVRFDADRPGERTHRADVVWSHAEVDGALLSVPQEKVDGPVLLGRVGERDAVLRCTTLGFPRFKLRADTGGGALAYRDTRHAEGSVPVLSNRREGTLELHVPPPEYDPDPLRSPWEGMSGAPVLSGGRLIGIVGRHHRSDGLGTLAVLRIDRWHARLSKAELDAVQSVLDLWIGPGDLPDVIPPGRGEVAQVAQLRQVRDIAPPELVGREGEIEELVTFCAGDERYQWWQALPWSGKTALASTFVLNPPAGVRPVSFFVTARWAEQADSDAFTDGLIAQLAPLAGIEAAAVGRDALRRLLFDRAAERLAEQGETLLLVVDGLDEDRAAGPDSARPSIAALLPPRPPANVRVLVTSRPHPGVPLDVPADHPLRHCPRRQLERNDFARHIQDEARRELYEALRGDQAQVDLLGLLTAAQGGLTARDLVELTGMMPFQLNTRLTSVLGRSLETRTRWDLTEEQGYLFAHETLREQAGQALGQSVAEYRARIHAWADGYRDQGWPENTPGYLLHTYGRLLAGAGDPDRYLATITDGRRQARLLAVTGSDAVAQAEIAAARRQLARSPQGDLGIVGELSLVADELVHRNAGLPVGLPAVWAALGLSAQAEGIARTLLDPWDRARAMARMAAGVAAADPRLARRVAAETDAWVPSGFADGEDSVAAYHHAEFCADRVIALVRVGEVRGALAEALRAPYAWERATILRKLAERSVAGGAGAPGELADAAEELAATTPRQPARTMLLACASLLVRDDDPERAERLARLAERIPPRRSALTLACLAVLTGRVEPERAARLADRGKLRAERRRIWGERAKGWLRATVRGFEISDDTDSLPVDTREALLHARLATGEADEGVFAFCAAAERGEEITLPAFGMPGSAEVRVCVAERLVAVGRHDEAREITAESPARDRAEVAAAFALSRAAEAPSDAATVARLLADESRKSPEGGRSALTPVLGVLSEALVAAGSADRAGQLARHAPELSDGWARTALYRAEGRAEATRVFHEVKPQFERAGSPGLLADDLEVVALVDGIDRAIEVARDDPIREAAAGFAALTRLLPGGDPRRAECAALARAKAHDEDGYQDPATPDMSDAWWAALAATLWGQPDAVRAWITGRVRGLAGRRAGANFLQPRLSWLRDPFERASAVLALSRVDADEAAARLREWRWQDTMIGDSPDRRADALWSTTALLMGIPAGGGTLPEPYRGMHIGVAALAALDGGREWCSLPRPRRRSTESDLRRLLLLDAHAGPCRVRDRAEGERLIRALLVRDDWWRALPALALLDPAAVRRVGDVVAVRLRRSPSPDRGAQGA